MNQGLHHVFVYNQRSLTQPLGLNQTRDYTRRTKEEQDLRTEHRVREEKPSVLLLLVKLSGSFSVCDTLCQNLQRYGLSKQTTHQIKQDTQLHIRKNLFYFYT